MSRKITVFSTETNDKVEIESSATTWGELKEEIENNPDPSKRLSTSNKKAMENVNKTTLGSLQSVLPTGPFTIYLAPEKVKSGKGLLAKKSTKKVAKKTVAKKSTTKKATKTTTVASGGKSTRQNMFSKFN